MPWKRNSLWTLQLIFSLVGFLLRRQVQKKLVIGYIASILFFRKAVKFIQADHRSFRLDLYGSSLQQLMPILIIKKFLIFLYGLIIFIFTWLSLFADHLINWMHFIRLLILPVLLTAIFFTNRFTFNHKCL